MGLCCSTDEQEHSEQYHNRQQEYQQQLQQRRPGHLQPSKQSKHDPRHRNSSYGVGMGIAMMMQQATALVAAPHSIDLVALEGQGLITGLIYNKPENPIEFLENAIGKVRQNPNLEYKWDSFVDEEVLQRYDEAVKPDLKIVPAEKPKKRTKSRVSTTASRQSERTTSRAGAAAATAAAVPTTIDLPLRPSSVMQAADAAQIPDVPIILFMGGPGGGKTRHAARVQEALAKFGLVHICMPDMIRAAIAKYQNTFPEWKEAAQRYQRGELIPNNLALGLVKAEMSKHPDAKAFFLEGFPREARQVEDFEREVRPVNMAMILDYDEATLRRHMESRGLDIEVIDARIREFKLKTLPSAKYFDDQRLLHLIPGEETDQWIFERMKRLIQRAMELGVPITTSKVASRVGSPQQRPDAVTTVAQAAAIVEKAAAAAEASASGSRPATKAEKKEDGSRPVTKAEKKEDGSRPATSASRAEAAPTTSAAAATAGTSRPVSKTAASRAASAAKKSISRASSKEHPSATPNGETSKAVETTESKPGTAQAGTDVEAAATVTEAAPVTATEVHEMPRMAKATVETVAMVHPTPASPVPAAAAPSETPSKPPSTSGTRRGSTKMSRTASQASKVSETSRQSIRNVKAEDLAVAAAAGKSALEQLISNTNINNRTLEDLVHNSPTGTTAAAAEQKPVSRTTSAMEKTRGAVGDEAVLVSQGVDDDVRRPDSQSSAGTPAAAGGVGAQLVNRRSSTPKSDSTAVNDRFPRGLPNNAPVIVIVGPPGSNKAEISRRIARKYDGFMYFSMGDLLRKEVQANANDELWQRIGKKMNAGEPVPTKICRELLYSLLYETGDTSWGYVVQGYPRAQNQAVDFENQLGRLDLVILVDCTEQFCIESIKKRREEGKQTRPDDDPEIVESRLAIFKQNTLPMLKYFDDKGILKVVDGDADLDKIFDDVVTEIDNTVFIEEQESGKSLSSSKASREGTREQQQ